MEENTSDCCPKNRVFCYVFIENPDGISGIIASNFYSTWWLARGYLSKMCLSKKWRHNTNSLAHVTLTTSLKLVLKICLRWSSCFLYAMFHGPMALHWTFFALNCSVWFIYFHSRLKASVLTGMLLVTGTFRPLFHQVWQWWNDDNNWWQGQATTNW